MIKFIIGGSLINMRERPYTQKANYGQEPVNNTIFGFGGTYSTELPFLTRLLNKVPSLQSDVPSNISVRGEVAFLRPVLLRVPISMENLPLILTTSRELRLL